MVHIGWNISATIIRLFYPTFANILLTTNIPENVQFCTIVSTNEYYYLNVYMSFNNCERHGTFTV